MLPIIFEVTAGRIPRDMLMTCWERVRRSFPEECGRAVWEKPTDVGIQRVTLEVPERVSVYEMLLGALTAIDVRSRQKWRFPSLLASHVRYHAEPVGFEIWASTPALFLRGKGDCEDMACDVAAELQLAGIAARAVLRLEDMVPTGDLWHVVTELPDGTIVDPSAMLGM